MPVDREELAKREIGVTDIRRPLAWALALAFLAVVYGIPAFDAATELARRRARGEPAWPLGARIVDLGAAALAPPAGASNGLPDRVRAANAALRVAIGGLEDTLEERSAIGQWVLTGSQRVLVGRLGLGNEKVYRGRGGWLFYAPAVDSLMQRPFLHPDALVPPGERKGQAVERRQRDPRRAVLQLHEQLAARGIALVLLPVPVKASLYPERLGLGSERAAPVRNGSFAAFVADVEREGVLVLDPMPALLRAKAAGGEPLYLATDTHWRPRAVELVAAALAAFVAANVELPDTGDPGWAIEEASASNRGDLAVMLKLPQGDGTFTDEDVTLRQVITSDDLLWRPEASADVLLLGDSFANVYSLGAMGWGESAGLAEHLAYRLRRPVDAIVRNDGASHATRLMLGQELARGRDRLAGKRVVIWEFTERELALGDWRLLPMEAAPPSPRSLWAPAAGESVVVSGAVLGMGVVPRPRGAPYADHVAAVHLVDLESELADLGGREMVVFVRTMVDYALTPAAGWRVGERVTLRVMPWAEAGDDIQTMMRSELTDPELLFAEPAWGEEVE